MQIPIKDHEESGKHDTNKQNSKALITKNELRVFLVSGRRIYGCREVMAKGFKVSFWNNKNVLNYTLVIEAQVSIY